MHEKHALPLPPQGAIDSGLSGRVASAGVGHGNRIGLQPRLRERGPCGKNRPPVNGRRGRIYFCNEVRACCRSSVVEHSLGKGEVVSSILPGSTRKPEENQNLANDALPYPPHLEREQDANFRTKLGEKNGESVPVTFRCAISPFQPSRAFALHWPAASRVLYSYRGETESVRSRLP